LANALLPGLWDTNLEKKLNVEARTEKWKPSTFNHYPSLLMLTYREARRAGQVSDHLGRDVRHRREDNSRVRYLNQREPAKTEVEYLRALKTEEARLRAVIEKKYPAHLPEFELAVSRGLRKGSMYSLTWEVVD
jgi:glycosidase